MEENKEINEQNVQEEKVNNKKNTFNIIIGIATLLIALLGVTFAYFSATARSRDGDVYVKSAYVSISYEGGTEIRAENLIPATETVAINKYLKAQDEFWLGEGQYAYEDDKQSLQSQIIEENDFTHEQKDRRCIDTNGKEVCYIYRFNITSDGEANSTTDILGGIKIDENAFSNLSYILFRVNYKENEGKKIIDKFGNRIVDTTPGNTPVRISDFGSANRYEQAREDYLNPSTTPFATFSAPFERIEGTTVIPIDCLFGHSDTFDSAEADDLNRCSTYAIPNGEPVYFELLVWLEETGTRQDEQDLEFRGTVLLEVPGGQTDSEYPDGKVTGKD